MNICTTQQFEFSTELTPGSIKTAMHAAGAASSDLWKVSPEKLHIIPGFNVRVKNDAYYAHIRELADSMKQEGFYMHEPLAGYVAMIDGEQTICVTDGHCRYEGAMLAIKEGAEIPVIPVVVAARGTSQEDLTIALVRSNSGKRLTPYETGIVCKRLMKFVGEQSIVANRLGLTQKYVEDLLLLVGAPIAVREMVEQDKVSAATATEAIKKYGDKAAEQLQQALGKAQASGKTKVTGKHLQPSFKGQVKKAAPKMFAVMTEVQADPAYATISAPLREKLDEIVAELQKLKSEETEEVGDSGRQTAIVYPE